MGRPVGVSIIAVLEFIGAGICLLAGIATLVGASFLGAMFSQAQAQGAPAAGGFMAMLGGAISIVFFVFAAIAGLLGWGLWTLKSWARIVVIVLSAIGILFSLLALLQFSSAVLMGIIIRVGINGLIIWYLLKPEVAAAFAGSQSRSATA
jgi:hypothetical protein